MEFKINMMYDDCTLRVTDHSEYEEPLKHSLVDFVIYIRDNEVLEDSKRILSPIVDNIYKYVPIKDGRYIYNRLYIPNIKAFITKEWDVCEDEEDPCEQAHYCITIEKDVYFEWDGNIYINRNDALEYHYKTWEWYEENVRDKACADCNCSDCLNIIEDWTELYDNDFIGRDAFIKHFFSICNLNTCVANAQKKWLLNNINTCGDLCKKKDETASQRDFLFITSYVLDYLISLEDYDTAEDIYDEVMNSCNNICDNGDNLTSKSCGCGK